MDLTLIMYREDGAHRTFKVTKPETIIGRREDCDLRIAVSDVSRKHTKLTLLSATAGRVEDLGSSNGTFVNGKRVTASTLSAGDVLQIGPVVFIVRVGSNPSEDSFAGRVAAAKAVAEPAAKPAAKSKAPSVAADDDDIDELSILNDSAGGSAVPLDLDDDKK